MSEREVKLTARDLRPEIVEHGIYASSAPYGSGSQLRRAYQAMHDAAPSDATETLEELVAALSQRQTARQEQDVVEGVACVKRACDALDRLRATPAGAALIRQAMERNK